MDLITGAVKDKMAVGGISLESSLFPCGLIGCPIPAHLTSLWCFSEIPSAPLPPLFPSQWHDSSTTWVVSILTQQHPSFLKPDPEWLKGFNGLQIWDHTHVWEKCYQILMCQTPLHGIWQSHLLSAQFNVVAGGQFDSWRVLPVNSFLPPLLTLHNIDTHWLEWKSSAKRD